MTKRRIKRFFENLGFSYDNNTYTRQGDKTEFVLFNKSLLVTRNMGTEYPELMMTVAFREIKSLVDLGKGLYIERRRG